MRKLLTAAFLVAGYTLHQANAQQATLLRKTPQKATVPRQATSGLSPTIVKEFCLNYPNAFYNLPQDYRLEAYYRFKAADLNLNGDIDFALSLSNSSTLREVAYKSLYDYCADIQFRYRQSIPEILYILLYNDLHMSVNSATLLVQYCEQRYHRAPAVEPEARSFTQLLTEKPDASPSSAEDTSPAAKGATAVREQPKQLYSEPSAARKPADYSSGLELTGWRFATTPVIEAVDDEPGTIRFKLKISDRGEVEAVTKLSGNVSSAQEKRCREALLNARLVSTNPTATAATGFYTFRFTVR